MAEPFHWHPNHAPLVKSCQDILTLNRQWRRKKPLPWMRQSEAHLRAEYAAWAGFTPDLHSKRPTSAASYYTPIVYGEAYPPSVEPLSKLIPIYIRSLTVDAHARKHVLIVRTFCQPIRHGCFHNAVWDKDGEPCRLEVYNISPHTDPKEVLPMDTVFAIKEPYVTIDLDGWMILRVDHPSDLVKLKAGDPMIPDELQYPSEDPPENPEDEASTEIKSELKVSDEKKALAKFLGTDIQHLDHWYMQSKLASIMERLANTAVMDNMLHKAHRCISDTIALLSANEKAAKSFWAPRIAKAHVDRLNARYDLGMYELAIQDGLVALDILNKITWIAGSGTRKDGPKCLASSLVGRALYDIGAYNAAQIYFYKALEVDPTYPLAMVGIVNTLNRLLETGVTPRTQADAVHKKRGLNLAAHGLMDREAGIKAYDPVKMSTTVTPTIRRLEHASCLLNTKIDKAAPGRGRGLFATKDLRQGELILIEKAFAITHAADHQEIPTYVGYTFDDNHYTTGTLTALQAEVVEKVRWNPTLAKAFFDLHDGRPTPLTTSVVKDSQTNIPEPDLSPKPTTIDAEPAPINIFTVHSIIKNNAFACPPLVSTATIPSDIDLDHPDWSKQSVNTSSGIWLRTAHANHSCIPNAHRAYIGDMLFLHAIRPIKEGEEITIDYLRAAGHTYWTRRLELAKKYKFACDCRLCQAEAHMPMEVQATRNRLRNEISTFLQEKVTQGLLWEEENEDKLRTAVDKGKLLLMEIRQCYLWEHDDGYREGLRYFGDLPRPDAVALGMWVAKLRRFLRTRETLIDSGKAQFGNPDPDDGDDKGKSKEELKGEVTAEQGVGLGISEAAGSSDAGVGKQKPEDKNQDKGKGKKKGAKQVGYIPGTGGSKKNAKEREARPTILDEAKLVSLKEELQMHIDVLRDCGYKVELQGGLNNSHLAIDRTNAMAFDSAIHAFTFLDYVLGDMNRTQASINAQEAAIYLYNTMYGTDELFYDRMYPVYDD